MIIQLGAFALVSAGLMGSECPSIPEIKERVVDLVLGKSVTLEFHAEGSSQVEDSATLILADFDLAGAIEEAGLDVSDVEQVFLTGVSYRIKNPDATPTRAIQNGMVEIRLGGIGAFSPLVENFNETVNDVVDFKTATLNPEGVTLINDQLSDYLSAVQNNPDEPVTTVLDYHWTGQTTPAEPSANFDWELKIDIEIVGNIQVDVIG
jgi:hypothetical protein